VTDTRETPPAPGGTANLGGRPVARIGFGAMQLGEGFGGRAGVSDEVAIAVLRDAAERGVDHIDTAEFYGEGTANRRIRAALAPYPESLALVSKVGADRRGAGLVAAQRPAELRASVEANLATLGTERLAVVNLRRADLPPGIVAEGEQQVDLDAQLAELVALRDEGKIGGIGLSHVSAEQVAKALPAGIAGTSSRAHLAENIAAGEVELDEEALKTLEEIGAATISR
jgi:pyridoxine 4-dehydrogenase